MASLAWQNDPENYLSDAIGVPVVVTSGKRSPQKNALVGGVPNSAHLTDLARDFVPRGISTAEATNRLVQSGIPFDQVYDEKDHVHVSFDPRMRGQIIPPKQGSMAQPQSNAPQGPSDDDIIAAITGKPLPKSAANFSQAATSGPSDEEIIKAIRGDVKPQAPVQSAPKPPQAKKPPEQPVSTFADVIRTIPGALAKGASTILGLPGDVNAGMNWLGDKAVGLFDPAAPAKMQAILESMNTYGFVSAPPTSENINKLVSEPFGGFYEPKTIAGKYTDTIGQFSPAALAPGGVLLRAGRAVLPGAASEAAGEATEGTPYEGVARLGGALLGAGALGGLKSMAHAPEPPPTSKELKTAANAAYKKAEDAGVVIKTDAVKNLGGEIQQAVKDAGIDPTLHPKAVAAVNRIVNSKGDLTLKDVDILRRVANGAAGSIDKDEARIAHIVVDHIDDFVKSLEPGDVLSGNTQTANDALTEARSLWAKQSKASVIDNLLERAKNRAETIGGSGLENGIRVEFRQLAQNEKRMARFSPEERTAIRDVARGGTLENIARTFGKLAPTSAIPILGELSAYAADPKAIALPIIGTAGRIAATSLTKRNAQIASELIRRGEPAEAQAIAPELLSGFLSRNRQESQAPLPPSVGPSLNQILQESKARANTGMATRLNMMHQMTKKAASR